MGKRYVWVVMRVILIWHINGYHKKEEVAFDVVQPLHRTKKEGLEYIKRFKNRKNMKYKIRKYEQP